MEQRSEHPPVTVYVSARVYDPTKARRDRKGRRIGGGMRHCWSIRLERWSPEEVERHIIELFTRLSAEETAALEDTSGRQQSGTGEAGVE